MRVVTFMVAALALSSAPLAFSGSASTTFEVSVTVLPTREQALSSAQISVQQPNGKRFVLDTQQQAEYIRDPSSIARHFERVTGERPVVLVHY